MSAVYFPLIVAILLIGFARTIYYFHRYEINNNSCLNKYRLPQEHILIRWRLFKYDNNFNYFLLIPYLITWNLFFVIATLYIIYWCGIASLKGLFINKWVNISLVLLGILYMGYGGIIQQVIRYSNRFEKPDFIIDSKDDKAEHNK